MNKHTPAPWITGEASWNDDGDARYTPHGIKELNAADARLIASAPELLDALENLCNHFDPEEQTMLLRIRLRHAKRVIDKVRGE